jgi:peptide deformylase
MAIRRIVLYPDPVLLRPTLPVEQIDDEVRELVGDMVETMHAAPGIGLAANQVGVSLRVCVVDLSAGEHVDALHVFINPKVLSSEGEQVGEEGCLSFPEITLDIERAFTATVEFLDFEGETTVVTAEGLMARAILHECEHLDGRVFLRNISTLKRELVKQQIRKRIKLGEWEEAGAK